MVSFVFALSGVSLVTPKMVVPMLACWQRRFHKHKRVKVRKAAPFMYFVDYVLRKKWQELR